MTDTYADAIYRDLQEASIAVSNAIYSEANDDLDGIRAYVHDAIAALTAVERKLDTLTDPATATEPECCS